MGSTCYFSWHKWAQQAGTPLHRAWLGAEDEEERTWTELQRDKSSEAKQKAYQDADNAAQKAYEALRAICID